MSGDQWTEEVLAIVPDMGAPFDHGGVTVTHTTDEYGDEWWTIRGSSGDYDVASCRTLAQVRDLAEQLLRIAGPA